MFTKILLFDVDGVLIHPRGYKVALRATINHFAELMGQDPVNVSDNEIAHFEACGLTNEWDSAAFSVGALLVDALNQQPDLRQGTFSNTLLTIRQRNLTIPRPDFSSLASQVAARNPDHGHVTPLCYELLAEKSSPDIHGLLFTLFEDIYSIDTPTTRIQQAHTLGSHNFAQTYGQPAPLAIEESYLKTHDVPLLSAESRDNLLDWGKKPDNYFSIFTARPALPPPGSAANPLGYAPEADLALELLELRDQAPLIAAGRMVWLASQNGRQPADYIKPSPVQALAAIGAALANDEMTGLDAAATFYEHQTLNGPFEQMKNEELHVVVFEDSTGGIRATQHAVKLLQDAGFNIQMQGVGVAPEEPKRQALARLTDILVEDVNKGLRWILNS
jgi:hypothetical protein